jgi:hypothetical protein
MPQAPSLGRTSFVVIWSFVVVSVIWTRLRTFYHDSIVAATNVLLPADLWLETRGASTLTVNHFADGETYRHGIDSLVLHSGLLIVLALVAGTPARSWLWRLIAAGYVSACFFLVQLGGMTVFAVMLRNSLSGSVLANDVQIGFAIFWALTPLAIGGAWAYRFWLPPFRIAPSPGTSPPA